MVDEHYLYYNFIDRVILVVDRECTKGYWILAMLVIMVFAPWVFQF